MPDTLKELHVPDDIAANELQFDHFVRMVADGQSEKMAAMLASQTAPGIGITNAIFQQDQRRHGNSILDRMNGDQRATERLRKQLASRGYKLKSDDHYIPTAAAFPGDPRAVVSNTRSHQEVQAHANDLAAKRARPQKKCSLNPRIVNRIAEKKIAEDPDLARKPRAELVESIVEQHGSGSSKE